jgi:hypothetical protein
MRDAVIVHVRWKTGFFNFSRRFGLLRSTKKAGVPKLLTPAGRALSNAFEF